MKLFGGVISISGVTFMLFCVFCVIFLGYALGRIRIKGVDLGTAGVFIAALVFGGLFYDKLQSQLLITDGDMVVDYAADALKVIENVGLVMFVTTVGFIAGPSFFVSIKKNFRSYVLLGVVIILSGALTAAGCIMIGRAMGEPDSKRLTAMVVGLFSGAMTSTPAFSAARATVAAGYEDIVSVGYGIAYIFGVIGVVLFVQLVPKILKADIDEEMKKILTSPDRRIGKQEKNRNEKDAGFLNLDAFGIAPFALCAVVGIVIGMIRIPLSPKGLSGTTFSLTTTGGCLLTALVFGHFGRIGRLNITPPTGMLKVFREFGLVLFLIGAGTSAGARFAENFRPVYFIYGAAITMISMIIGYFFASRVLKLQLMNTLSAITGGMTSTPALGTLITLAGSEEVASAYAATYPFALICVVLSTQIINIVF